MRKLNDKRYSSENRIQGSRQGGNCLAGPCPYRKLYPTVLMMKSAEDRLIDDLADRLDRPMAR